MFLLVHLRLFGEKKTKKRVCIGFQTFSGTRINRTSTYCGGERVGEQKQNKPSRMARESLTDHRSAAGESAVPTAPRPDPESKAGAIKGKNLSAQLKNPPPQQSFISHLATSVCPGRVLGGFLSQGETKGGRGDQERDVLAAVVVVRL